MKTRTIATASLVAAGAALARPETAGSLGTTLPEPSTGSPLLQEEPSVQVGGLVQTRYTFNHRDDEDDTIGFSQPRVRLWFQGDITESFGFYVRGQFSGSRKVPGFEEESIDGILDLDRAFAIFTLTEEYSVRIGQQAFDMSRENANAPQDQLGVNSSATDSVFGLGGFKGIQFHAKHDDWRGWATFSDGSRNTNSDFDDPDQADFGLTGKLDYKFAGDWSRFDNFTSFRGTELAAMAGLGVHWENGAVAGPSAITLFQLVTELSLEGDGWNAHGAFHWARNDFLVSSPADDFGVVVQGGYFVSDDVELYARYDAVFPDSDRADTPSERGGIFQTATIGVTHYMIPESNALKISADFQYSFDSEDDSLVQPSSRTSVLASDESQYALRVQLSAKF